jgi:hypothetical protein
MIRNAEGKLIMSETQPSEWYHMNGGWQEKENLSNDYTHQKVFDEMKRRIKDFWRWERTNELNCSSDLRAEIKLVALPNHCCIAFHR